MIMHRISSTFYKVRTALQDDPSKSSFFVVNLLSSILLGVLSPRAIDISPAEQLILGVCVFIALELLQLVRALFALVVQQTSELEQWPRRVESIEKFKRMAEDFGNVCQRSHGPKDLFVSHLFRDILRMEERLSAASELAELRIVDDHIINVDGVFDSLIGVDAKEVRLAWPILPNGRMFQNAAERRFFEVLRDMVAKGRVSAARFLFVVPAGVEKTNSSFLAFAKFVSGQTGFSFRWIEQSAFEDVLSANSLSRTDIDMGIYSNRMLYRTEQFEPKHIAVYSKDSAKIAIYLRIFDETWNSQGLSHSASSLSLPATAAYDQIC